MHARIALLATPAALAAVAASFVHRSTFFGLSVDDAYITFRYARNWARGIGPVYNVGEAVEGYSNFLWLCLLTLFAKLGGADFDMAAQSLGVVASIACVALAPWALWRVYGITHRGWLVSAALVVGTSGYVTAWAVGGLEGPLYGLLLLGIVASFAIEHEHEGYAPATAALCILLALTRPEGQLLACGVMLAHIVVTRRARGGRVLSAPALLTPSVFAFAIGAYQAFRTAHYGLHLWPNSVRAKLGFSLDQTVRGLVHLATTFLDPYGLLLVAALAFVLAHRDRREASWLGIAFIAATLGSIAVAGGDWSLGRLGAPLVPLLSVLGIAGIYELAKRIERPMVARALVAAVGLYLTYIAAVTQLREHYYRSIYAPVDRERVAIGRWLAIHATPDTVLAVTGAGQIPFYSDLYTHDLFGLNDAHIASLRPQGPRMGLAGHDKYDVLYSVEVVKPQVIVGASFVPGMMEYLRRSGRYVLVPLPHEQVVIEKGLFSSLPVRELQAAVRR
jgi:arabinofuranosyltransferase